MPLPSLLRVMILACALVLSPLTAELAPAYAASDAAMLQSYAGSYTGSGTVTGDTGNETVRCRLNLQSIAPGRVDYTGRCSVGGTSFSMTGIISAAKGGFTAAMSSSTTGTSATVTGRRRGAGVVFSSTQNVTLQGRQRAVSSTMTLSGGMIAVDYKVVDSKTGKTTAGSIPFSKLSH